MNLHRRPAAWVFVLLLGSNAFYWQARDWNSASRLMLTYAIVDRGTIRLDGLDDQTGDKAKFEGHFYTDKLPGYSLLATIPYLACKRLLRLPDHPLNRAGFAYWPADYWVTLGTSGFLTALTGALLAVLARDLGCGPRRAALVGLAYGLATPAFVYATMSYGHQASAAFLLASFALLWKVEAKRAAARMVAAGALASYAAVIELQVGPISALLGIDLVAQVVGRRRRPSAVGDFGVGALVPALLLLGYNQLAFGSPWQMGYFHHATAIFRDVHSAQNPLGLRPPDASHAWPLLWGTYRGLAFYAPIVLLAIPGWVALARGRSREVAVVSALAVLAMFLINLSYPEWTGGWCTGPRLLVPLLPFAMLPVAAALAAGGPKATWAAVLLAVSGGLIIALFQGVGARIPQFVADPLNQAVLPIWRGEPLPPWASNGRFTRTVADLLVRPAADPNPSRSSGWILGVLPVFQAVGFAAMAACLRPSRSKVGPVVAGGVPPPGC